MDLYTCDIGNNFIRKHLGFSTTLIARIPSPSTETEGIAFNGRELFVVDSVQDLLFRADGFINVWFATFNFDVFGISTEITDVCFDGRNIFVSEASQNRIFRFIHRGVYAGTRTTIFQEYITGLPGVDYYGITFDGRNIIGSSRASDRIYKLVGFTNSLQDYITSPGGGGPATSGPECLAFDGRNIYVANSANDTIYKLAGFSEIVAQSFVTPTSSVSGITFEGREPNPSRTLGFW